jgi:hypothetical protein
LLLEAEDGTNYIYAVDNGSVRLYHPDATNGVKLATTATGIDISGTATMDGLTVDGNASIGTSGTSVLDFERSGANYIRANNSGTGRLHLGAGSDLRFHTGQADNEFTENERMRISSNGDISFYEDTGTTAKLTWSASGEDLNFADNVKATFGDGDDLQIYHDGSNSYIEDGGVGNLNVKTNVFRVYNAAGDEISANFVQNGAVTLYHDGAAKLATTSTGIDVTGTATMDGLTVDGTANFNSNNVVHTATTPNYVLSESDVVDENTQFVQASGTLRIRTVTDAGALVAERLRIDHATGDISFYEDTGTTPKFVWSSSAEKLTLSGTGGLNVDGASAGTVTAATFENTTSANGTRVQTILQNASAVCSVNLVSERVGANFGADFIVETSDTIDGTNRQRLRVAETGDISFYEDTGSSPKFVWDSSAESLGIGTSSPQTIHGGASLDGETSTGFEFIAGNSTVATVGGEFLGGYAFRNNDSSGTPDHYSGIRAVASDSFGSANLEFYAGRDSYEAGTSPHMTIRGDTNDALNGFVGIGTSLPASSLDIRSANTAVQSRGNLYVTTTSTAAINEGAQISLGGTYTGTGETFFGAIAARKENATVGDFNAYLQFSVRNTGGMGEKMRIDSSGRVGIGTNAPATALDVNGTITADGLVVEGNTYIDTNNGADAFYVTRYGSVQNESASFVIDDGALTINSIQDEQYGSFRINSTHDGVGTATRFNIDNDGDISFYEDQGVTPKFFWDSSAETLMLNASTRIGTEILTVNGTVTTGGGTASAPALAFRADSNTGMFRPASQELGFSTAGTERARLTSDGSLLVGGISKTSIPSLNNGVYLQSQTNGDVLGYSLYSNEGTNNRRVAFFLDDTNGVYGFDSSAASGIPEFVIRRAGSEQMRLTSTGLGIGTSSPAALLEINKDSEGEYLRVGGDNASNARSLRFTSSTSSTGSNGALHTIKANSTAGEIAFANGDGNIMYLDSSGNVGIGTSSPATALDVVGTVTADGLTVDAGRISIDGGTDRTINITNGSGADRFTINNVVASGATSITQTLSYLSFVMGASEAMRIDSSGNLLVGTTSVQGAGGVTLSEAGYVYSSRPSSVAIYADRTGSDGTIQEFRQSGTSVGSIGNNTDFYIASQDGTGLRFTSNQVLPCSESGAIQNGSRDLGSSSGRFKDLYLSGGVYLGGTGAANLLDDYEEGTWTGKLDGLLATATTGKYTKVGNLVTVSIYFDNVDTTGAAGAWVVEGLPFTVVGNTTGSVWSTRLTNETDSKVLVANTGYTTASIISGAGDNGTWASAGTGTYAMLTIQYMTS